MNEFAASTGLAGLLVPAVGRALLHFLWQGVAIGLAAAIALQSLRDARPQARYAVACIAMLACILAPVATVLLGVASSHAIAAMPALPVADVGTAVVTKASEANDIAWWSGIDAALPTVVAMWAAGASAFCLRLGAGALWLRQLRATPQDTTQPDWQARLDRIAAAFDMRGVALRIVPVLDTPVAAGWLRPMVLLPAAVAARMPVALVEALLAHELAHIRRHDYLVNLLQNLVEALLFYHPVVWWLSRRVRVEREHIADAMAADAIGDPRRLALALSALADITPFPRLPSRLAPAAHGAPLMSRIQHLVRPGNQRPHAGRIALPVLGIAAACMAFYAQARIGEPTQAQQAHPVAGASAAETARIDAAAEAVQAQKAAQAATSASRDAARAAAQARAVAQARAAAHPRTATASARVAARTVHLDEETRDAFALVRKGEDGMTVAGSSRDMSAIEHARRSLDGDFLWFRRGDQAYVVVDPAVVARAQGIWTDSNVLGGKMEALGREMGVHGRKMEAYGAQMEKLAGTRKPSPAMQQAQERMQALAEEQQLLAGHQVKLARDMRKADDAEREAMEARSDRLSAQMEALGEQMERQGRIIEAETAQLERNREPMEALGRQMEEASKPMEALGARMDVLGRQQETLVRKAERETQALISESLEKGLAKPAPGNTQSQ